MKPFAHLYYYLTQACRRGIRCWLLLLVVATSLSSCGLMEEDRSECPMGLYVTFVYDYTLDEQNIIDQLGGLTCYVVGENDKVVAVRHIEKKENGVSSSFFGRMIHFPEVAPGTYRLVTIGGETAATYTRSGEDPLFHRLPTSFGVGSNIHDLRIRLDRDVQPTTLRYMALNKVNQWVEESMEAYSVGRQTDALDSLWLPLNRTVDNRTGGETLDEYRRWEVHSQKPTYATAYLMRATKEVSIIVKEMLTPSQMEGATFEAYITAENGDFDAAAHPVGEQRLLYLPFEVEQTMYANDGTNGTTANTAYPRTSETQFELSIPRIVLHEDVERDAYLYIIDKKTGHAIVRENLPNLLVSYRLKGKRTKYTPQEVLDRLHDYSLQFYLVNGQWEKIDIDLRILKWENRRTQGVDF